MIEVGDRVRFLDFEGEGTVLSVSANGILSVDMDGMEMPVHTSEVAKVEGATIEDETAMYGNAASHKDARPGNYIGHKSNMSGGRASSSAGVRHNFKKTGGKYKPVTMEVDLHFNAIRSKYPAAKNIPQEECLEVQLDVFEKSLDDALRKGVSSIVFIHGVGSGVLRQEIVRRLRRRGLRYEPASAFRYGNGAVEVEL